MPPERKIKSLKPLPFAMHDLLDLPLSLHELEQALLYLQQTGAIYGYGPLVETKGSLVAQAEHSILVDEKGVITVTTAQRFHAKTDQRHH
jgi:methionyl aminopeptidase